MRKFFYLAALLAHLLVLVAGAVLGQVRESMQWREVLPLLLQFFTMNLAHYDAHYAPNPLKQWLVYLRGHYFPAALLFEKVKRLRDPAQVHSALVAAIAEAAAECRQLAVQEPALRTA